MASRPTGVSVELSSQRSAAPMSPGPPGPAGEEAPLEEPYWTEHGRSSASMDAGPSWLSTLGDMDQVSSQAPGARGAGAAAAASPAGGRGGGAGGPGSARRGDGGDAAPPSGGWRGSGSEASHHGLAYWLTVRRDWTLGAAAAGAAGAAGAASPAAPAAAPRRGPRRPVLAPDATYEDILLTDKPFPVPVPLPEMVDFLVDCWDQDGLYD